MNSHSRKAEKNPGRDVEECEGTYIDCDIMLFPILDSKESVQGMLLMLTGKESATYVVY